MSASKASTGQRLQDGVLVCIVLAVGVMAGAASFSHVHDWTMHNSPHGTGDWFGWANAVITELIPTAALIVIGRRRRTGDPIGYPMLLLVIAVGLSLTAQLAVAEFTVFGWMVSALPALAFFALSKLVFTATRPTNPVPATTPATVAPAPSDQDTAPATVRPAAEPTPATAPQRYEHTTMDIGEQAPAPAAVTITPARTTDDPAPAVSAASLSHDDLAALLPGARIMARAHQEAHGERINAGQLAVRLQVPSQVAKDVLHLLYPEPTTNTGPHNGAAIGATR
jgi:hypothetical protein